MPINLTTNHYNKILSKSQGSLRQFVESFGYLDDDTIYLQTLVPNGCHDGFPQAMACNVGELLDDHSELRRRVVELNKTMGVYFCPNQGGRSDDDIHTFTAFFVDFDKDSKPAQLALINDSPLPPSIILETKRGYHAYWLIAGKASNARWTDIQRRLIAYFGSDGSINNPGRCMRMPFFNYVSFENGNYEYEEVPLLKFDSTLRYSEGEMVQNFAPAIPIVSSAYSDTDIYGGPYKKLKEYIIQNGRKQRNGIYETRGVCHNGEGSTALCFNSLNGRVWCSFCTVGKGGHLDDVCAAIGIEVCDISDINARSAVKTVPEASQPIRHQASYIHPLSELVSKDLPPINWTIGDVIPEGAMLFFSPPKTGKSLAALDLILAVGCGGNWLEHYPVTKGRALYLDLENGETILQKRVLSRLSDSASAQNVDYALEWPRLSEGGLEQLEEWLVRNPDARLIVIDTLERIRPLTANRNPYREDYQAVSQLNDLAHKFHVSILIVHHTNQQQGEDVDFYIACSGTNGFVSLP